MADAMIKEATPKKVAFVSKPYTQEERIKKEEAELEQLIKEHKGEAENKLKNRKIRMKKNRLLLKRKLLKSVMETYEDIPKKKKESFRNNLTI